MKLPVIIAFTSLCFAFFFVFGDTERDPGTNQGIVHFRSYFVQVQDSFNYEKKIRFFDTAVYYIKDKKVLRLPYKTESKLITAGSDPSGNQFSFYEDLSHPGYLLDLDKKLVFHFQEKSSQIIERPMDSLRSEILFARNNYWKTKLIKTISLNRTPVYPGNNGSYFNGVGLNKETGDTIIFRCTKQPLNLASPLNYFFEQVAFPVVSIGLGVKDQRSGRIGKWLVYEITGVERKQIDDRYFYIDTKRVTKIIPTNKK